MDKIVEIANFQKQADAHALQSLLKSEGIWCVLQGELINQVYGNMVDLGGIRVEILEKDLPHALKIMEAYGYPVGGEEEEPAQLKTISSFSERIPFLRKLPLEKQIIVILVITAVLLGLLLYLGSSLSASHV